MQNLSATNPAQQLFESGSVDLKQGTNIAPVEIKRGMTILTQAGQKAGRVAAVMLSHDGRTITHLLVTTGAQTSDYRLAPVNLIKQVTEETILLDLKTIEHLPHREEGQ